MGAAGIAAQAIGAVVGIGSAIWGAHTARLAGAKNENAAWPQAVQAMDQDIAQIVQAYNAGTLSYIDASNALATVDSQIYSYMQSLVGHAGTAWRGTPGDCRGTGRSAACNKSCTAGCCVYYNVLDPSVKCAQEALNSADRTGRGSATMILVKSNKYGGLDRPAYVITFVRPKAVNALVGGVASAVQTITGTATSPAGGPITAAVAQLLGAPGGTTLIVVGLGFLLLIVGISLGRK